MSLVFPPRITQGWSSGFRPEIGKKLRQTTFLR